MKIKFFCAAATVTTLALLLSAPLEAQWLNFKTPGIPRTADGKPDVSAPAPRAADGKPDLSGIWRAPANSPYLRNIAVDLKSGEILPPAQALYEQHVLDLGADSPRAHCLPDPPPYYHLAGMSRIVQTPALMVIINEGNSNSNVTRTMFTDGRALPEEMDPTWLGYSVGPWEGDTLVVTTAGFNDRTWLDFVGHPHSEALRITERFHRRDFGHMDFEMTLEDPRTFTKPITFKADKTLVVDTELFETICEYEQHAQHLVGGNRFRLNREALARYAGTYEFAPGREAVITVDGELLVLHLGATGEVEPLAAQSETSFTAALFGDQVEFVKDSGGAMTGFTLRTGTGTGLGNRALTEQKAVRKGGPAPASR
ncbi:MAG: hypothetical protein DMG13_14960 [Acidobacteria bacterium]|nr:MAG: hypothetical protein DMG13_14960 [Acidobacteriota bacterium]